MIDTAVLLAAGEGSRLRDVAPYKPLCPVGGRPLIDHALAGFAAAGLRRVIVVTSYGADAIAAHLNASSQPIAVEIAHGDHCRPNGVSVLAAAPYLAGGAAVLAMCDHLVDPALYARLAQAGVGAGTIAGTGTEFGMDAGLRLGIDRRLGHDWVDPDDVTCVATEGDRIVAIGKGLVPHDCYDVGVFAIGPALMAALATLAAPSLTEGVRLLAAAGRAAVVDCSDLDWIDVDDPAALAKAEAWQALAAVGL